MRWRVVKQVARTAFVEFWRSPAAVFWTYGFPLMMAVVLGFAFQPGTPPPVPIAIVDVPGASAMYATMQATERLSVELLPAKEADLALARGRVALLIKYDQDGPLLRSDPTRPEAELARLLVERALYDAREAGYLLGRSILVIPEALVIMLFGVLLWDVPFRGSYLAAFLAIVIGGWTFTGIGCLCASRARTIETIGGLMNAVQLPMWILGGTFFANEALEGPVRWVAECLPLTHVNRTLRDVMLESGSLLDVWLPLTALAAGGLVCFGLAMRMFRWQ